MEPRGCMLARRAGRESPCRDGCAFWETGGAALPAGCALERILAEEDWPRDLALRWLRIRDAAGFGPRRLGASLMSELLT